MKLLLSILIITITLSLASCSDYYPELGTVAQVNGKNILLKDLEAIKDSNNVGLISNDLDYSTEALKTSYAKALSELIIIALVDEELEKRGLSITDADVDNEEAIITADYPEGEFKRQLLEDRLDINVWRKQLRGRLAVQRFREKVIQPLISVTTEEFKEYHQKHPKTLPNQKYFRVLQSENKEILQKAIQTATQIKLPDNFKDTFNGVTIKEARLAVERIEPQTLKILDKLQPGQSSIIEKNSDSNEYVVYILLENIEGRIVDFSESFQLNEKAILEEKLDFAFKIWLQTAIRKAKIKISKHLLLNPKTNNTPDLLDEKTSTETNNNTLPTLPKPALELNQTNSTLFNN